jgi:hypothetical protein
MLVHFSPKRERKIPVHMQGGDFVYGSAGAQDAQQPKSVDKSGKKGSFQLSKILPSPSKKIICQLSDDRLEVSELLPTEEKIQTEKVDKKDHTDDAEEKKESDDETSDGDWYEYKLLCIMVNCNCTILISKDS